jgi:hypothetical protein
LEKLGLVANLRTTSAPEILDYARRNYEMGECVDWDDFASKLRKKKMIIKRNHAKNRSRG